jgi:2-polyprenyl-3-methyl-5-hydroxy-6-metoxy-1,4-benzoquinol methylase
MRGAVLLASPTERRAVAPVLAEIDEAARALRPSGTELWVVLLDRGGLDGTSELALDTAKRLDLDAEVLIVGSVSPAAATMRGLEHVLAVDADFVVTLDADGQHDGRQIPDLVRAWEARGSGLTIGSRWVRGGSSPGTGPLRTTASRAANVVARAVTGLRSVRDTTTSFRVYHPDVARLLTPANVPVEGYAFYSAVVAITQAHGFSVDEVPITFRPRYSGVERLQRTDVTEFVEGMRATRREVSALRRRHRSNQALWAQRSARLRAQGGDSGSVFGATEELARLADADRFLTWIAAELDPYLGDRVLEVGAGLGAVTRKFATARPSREIIALEPAANVFDSLAINVADHPNIIARQQTSADLLASDGTGRFDSVVYVSVLEHILDDIGELRTARRLLVPGGHVALFVPAMPSLYGSLDFKSGHYRRYDAALLRSVIAGADLELVEMHHLDLAGVIPYWLMYRVLDRQTLDARSSAVYDRLIVPVSQALQRSPAHPPRGKNLVAVARRP